MAETEDDFWAQIIANLGNSHTGDIADWLNGGSGGGGGTDFPNVFDWPDWPETPETGGNPGTGGGGGGDVGSPNTTSTLSKYGPLVLTGLDAFVKYLMGSKQAGAASDAAETQSQAALAAAQATADASKYNTDALMKAAQEANTLQELQAILARQDTAPYRETGAGALPTLKDLLQPGGYLAESAPQFNFDASKVSQDPGYDFALKEGQKALERSAAARGNVLSGATAKAVTRYGQDYATGKVNDVYNRQLSTYNTNLNTEELNRSNLFNRLSSLAGTGQQATGTGIVAGQNAANQIGSNITGTATNVGNMNMNAVNAAGNYNTQAANARASGYVGGANAWSGMVGNLGNLPYQYLTLQEILKGGRN